MDICVTPVIGVAAAAIALCTSEALMTLPQWELRDKHNSQDT
jgi:hypothetical protein